MTSVSTPFATIEQAIDDIRQGKMVVVCDDENRENEGDLTMAAQFVTPEAINFMAKEGRGLICLSLTAERCDELGLDLMAAKNESPFETPFTVSIEARDGVTTGISAADRAQTIRAAVAPGAKPTDIVQPGHIFPIRAEAGGQAPAEATVTVADTTSDARTSPSPASVVPPPPLPLAYSPDVPLELPARDQVREYQLGQRRAAQVAGVFGLD